MPRPRSNKPRKGSGTSFGKRSDAEKSYRKKGSSSRSDSAGDSKRSFGKPSGYRKSSSSNAEGSGEKRSFGKEGRSAPGGFRSDSKRPYRSNPDSAGSAGAGNFPRSERPAGGFRKEFTKDFKKSGGFQKRDDNRAGGKSYGADRGKRPFHSGERDDSKSDFRSSRSDFKKPFSKPGGFEKRPDQRADNNPDKKSFGKDERKAFVQAKAVSISDFTKPERKSKDSFSGAPARKEKTEREGPPKELSKKRIPPQAETEKPEGLSRLNKYIANSGVGSRRDADKLITMGLISVNGTVITELGTKVKQGDVIKYEDRILKAEKPVYILLNKPKGFITTTDDPKERNTVMGLVAGACKERIYPVGRLDRNTTGLLLLTNDGDLADKLTHPSYKAKKVYKVELDKPLTKNDFQKIVDGVHLEEGRAMVDDVAIVSDDNKTIGLEIHIGWNRVVRRIFETLGYNVVKLDRSVYAGLDKKDTPRGNWRFLKSEEIVMLKHFK